ncbi:putative capsid maturation protease [Glutamicibacter phage BIM BV-113]|nr:putative capsid maturation protease [Glutamicibacter phage BIM BV-113]
MDPPVGRKYTLPTRHSWPGQAPGSPGVSFALSKPMQTIIGGTVPKKIREAATATRRGPGRILLTLISPGAGSSGDYAPEVLATAAAERAFPRGTLGMIDHDTPTEMMERPEGSLRNLAIVLDEDAYIGEGGALQAEAKVATAWRDLVEDFHEHIGASIFASAEISTNATGQKVVERIIPDPFNRADLVTVAGRGGKIDQVLEAAKVIESRSIIAEATASDIRMWLQATVRATQDDYAWVADHDETYVYYEIGDKYFRETYELTGVNVTLSGDPVEVRRRVEYDPVISPPVPAGVTENQEEATMATIDDKELADLRESASRATALETERDEAVKRAEAAEAKNLADAKEHRLTTASNIISEAFGADAPAIYGRMAKYVAESEDFDADTFRTEVTEAAAQLEANNGAGTPRGMGGHTASVSESKTISDEDILAALHGKA